VIISNSIEWLSLDDWQTERSSLLQMIEEWRQDWESRDIDQYAQHYSHKLQGRRPGLQGLGRAEAPVNAGKTWIKVATGNISMFRNPARKNMSWLPSSRTTAPATCPTR
jgi:hypothetical protein